MLIWKGWEVTKKELIKLIEDIRKEDVARFMSDSGELLPLEIRQRIDKALEGV